MTGPPLAFYLSMFNLGMICVLTFLLWKSNKRFDSMVNINKELVERIIGFSMLTGMLIDRAAGMISCDVCHESIRSGQPLRTDLGPDIQLLAHAECH